MKRAPMLRRLGRFALGLSAALLAGGDRSARAAVTPPNLFGSPMVLQKKRKDRVWGWADPGEEVTVTIGDQSQTDQNGKRSVTLDPLPARGPHTLTVTGKNMVTFDDVLVGEVWLRSGQSNLEFDVSLSNRR